MSLPHYSKYKQSGAGWLGNIPEHWTLVQSRRYFAQRKERAMASDKQLTASQKYGVMYQDAFMELEGQKVVQVIVGADILKHVEPNDFVISMRSFQGGIEWSAFRGSISSAYVMLIPSASIHTKFFCYLFKSRPYIQALQATTNLVRDGQALRFDNFAQVPLPLIPMAEQAAIAAFLDRETHKIDALIAEQEKLLCLLAEKRQATILHAVTRGVNPDAPMKDSGVAWLGEVPAHWEVKQLRHIAKVVRGASPRPAGDPKFFVTENDDGQNTPWVTVAEVTKDDGAYLTEVSEYLTPLGVRNSQRFKSGTLVFTNSGATLGVPKILAIDCCANDGIVAFNDISMDADVRFVYAFLSTTTERLRTEMKQGGGQPNLNTGIVKNISFALPPREEQLAIVCCLATEAAKLDALKVEAERGIALLKERRSALIAAAVTGKIDVRQQIAVLEAAA